MINHRRGKNDNLHENKTSKIAFKFSNQSPPNKKPESLNGDDNENRLN